MEKIYLSMIIPAYNELDNFQKGSLDKVDKYLKNFKKSYEVLVVDDGSNDGSLPFLKKYCQQRKNWCLIKRKHAGKARTVAAGVEKAKGGLILFTDFDQATSLSEIEKLLPFIKKGNGIVIGSREVKGAERVGEPWYRHLMGKAFNFIVNNIAFRGIRDTQCGFKLFKAEVAKKIFNKLIVYEKGIEDKAFTGAFDVELLYIASKLDIPIAEVPISWQHIETNRVDPIRDSTKMFFDVIKIKLNGILGKYN